MRAARSETSRVSASEVRARARAPRWVMPAVKAALVLTDACVAAASFFAAFALREGGATLVAFSWQRGFVWHPHFEPYAALLWLVLPIRLLLLAYYDLYRLRGEFSLLEDSLRVFKATAVASLLIVAAAFLYRGGYEFRTFSYARGVFVLDFALALAAYASLRLLARTSQSAARRRGINLIPTLVVGRGREAALCVREMRARRELGYRVIGIVEAGRATRERPWSSRACPLSATSRD